MEDSNNNVYLYSPSHALPAVFAALVGVSLLLHIYQNFRYRFWRVTFFMFWAGVVFTTGWIIRCISSYHPANVNLYIAQTVFIYAGPPIYSAAEYNVLGRLMNYVPMHAPLNPNRLLYFFIYLGAAVESLTGAGAALIATAPASGRENQLMTGGTLVSIALVLQGAVEIVFIAMVALIHRRCARARMVSRNIRNLCIMLYGTSTLILIRCIFRAIESFSTMTSTNCTGLCRVVSYHEWYLYVFEAAPMVIYTYWINIVHPGRLLPRQKFQYLDIDGQTERLGPGWIDRRSTWATFVDPFDIVNTAKGQPSHEKFWLSAEDWSAAINGSFAQGTGSNVRSRKIAELGSEETTIKG